MCGYRANRGELALDDNGSPVVGIWETICSPEKWAAVCATFGDGSTYLARGSGAPSITGVPKTIKYLGSTLLRCQYRFVDEVDGRTVLAQVCNKPMSGQKTTSKRSPYVYLCSRCSRNSVSGPMVDSQLQRLLLAKLDQAQATYVSPDATWPKESQLRQQSDKLAELEDQWTKDEISNEMFYRLAPRIESEVKSLRRERAQFEMAWQSKSEAPGDVARKWLASEYDLEQKRKVLFEVFAAVQVLPGQKGCKTPDPKRLVPVWKQ